MSFFLHHLSHRQIAQFFAHPHQLIDGRFKLTHGLNLLAIERDQLGIGQTQGNGPLSLFAREQRIRAALNPRAVGMLDRQELIGQATAPQFLQAGKLLEEGLALMFQVGVIREVLFHIVVILLQYSSKTQGKSSKPTFISSTLPVLRLCDFALQ
jgi:hypothetical protein